MRSIFAFVVIALFTPLPSQARLRETVEECVARYGNPVERDEVAKTLAFVKNGVFIVAKFTFENRCHMLGFKKTDESGFSDNEIDLLLKANIPDGADEQMEIIDKKWMGKNGDIAAYKTFTKELFFMTKEQLDHQRQETKAKEKESLNGF